MTKRKKGLLWIFIPLIIFIIIFPTFVILRKFDVPISICADNYCSHNNIIANITVSGKFLLSSLLIDSLLIVIGLIKGIPSLNKTNNISSQDQQFIKTARRRKGLRWIIIPLIISVVLGFVCLYFKHCVDNSFYCPNSEYDFMCMDDPRAILYRSEYYITSLFFYLSLILLIYGSSVGIPYLRKKD